MLGSYGVRERYMAARRASSGQPPPACCAICNGNFQLALSRLLKPGGCGPDMEVLQEPPADLKARGDAESEASLRGHLKAVGTEETGSQSYVPPDGKDDRALKEALDFLRGTIADAAFPPNPKATVP
jgi:carboxyl-terminal processing protease